VKIPGAFSQRVWICNHGKAWEDVQKNMAQRYEVLELLQKVQEFAGTSEKGLFTENHFSNKAP